MIEENEYAESQPEVSAVARAKAGFELFGEPLHAYSGSRYTAGQSMGVLYPYIGEGAALQWKATGVYPGASKDMACVLWLCSLKDKLTKEEAKAGEWTPSRALISPIAALEAAIEWAASKDILRTDSTKFNEAFEVFMDVVAPVEEAKFTVESGEQERDDGSPKV